MPFSAKSAAIERVIAIRPALAAAYMAVRREKRKAPAEMTLRMAALPDASRWGSARSTRNTGPRRLVSSDLAQASSVSWPNGRVSALAALFTTMSRRPNRSTVRSTRLSMAAMSAMWVGTPRASPPISLRWASVTSQASALRLPTATLAPAACRPSAMARPMPRVPPVTIATRPVRSCRLASFCRSMTGSCPRGAPRRLGTEQYNAVMIWSGLVDAPTGGSRRHRTGRRAPRPDAPTHEGRTDP